MKDLISIVVPIYKVEKYLERCIKSILEQTYTNLEVILVDDGSPDSCPMICDTYQQLDSRIKVIHKINGGLSDARNAGLEIATGKYIAFIDSDDFINCHFIERLYNLCVNSNTQIAICDFQSVRKEQEVQMQQETIKTSMFSSKEMLEKIYGDEHIVAIVAWNKLYQRELFEDIRYPKGKINEDEFTTYKLFSKANKIAFTNEKLYYYFYAEDSIMRKKFHLRRLDYIEGIEGQMEFYQKQGAMDLYIKAKRRYAYALIEYYHRTRKDIEDSEQIQKELYTKFKRTLKSILFMQNIRIKDKGKLLFAYLFPKIYEKKYIQY